MLKPTFSVNPVVVVLMALMTATRFHHTGNAFALPDASLAIFFAAGLWVGGRWVFALLLAEAALIDYLAITHLGVSDFCISPAYAFLLPAYAILWQAGKISRTLNSASWQHAAQQLVVLGIAASLAFLLTNGSFFLLSDKITDKSWAQYTARALRYYPMYVEITVAYGMSFWALVQASKAVWSAKWSKHTA